MYTCLHVYMYTSKHVNMYTCIHVNMYACIHVYMYTCYKEIETCYNMHRMALANAYMPG